MDAKEQVELSKRLGIVGVVSAVDDVEALEGVGIEQL